MNEEGSACGSLSSRPKSEYREFDSWCASEYRFDDKAKAPFNCLFYFLNHVRTSDYPGIEYRASTPIEDLVQDGEGRVAGIIAKGKRMADELKNTDDAWNRSCEEEKDLAFYRPFKRNRARIIGRIFRRLRWMRSIVLEYRNSRK